MLYNAMEFCREGRILGRKVLDLSENRWYNMPCQFYGGVFKCLL